MTDILNLSYLSDQEVVSNLVNLSDDTNSNECDVLHVLDDETGNSSDGLRRFISPGELRRLHSVGLDHFSYHVDFDRSFRSQEIREAIEDVLIEIIDEHYPNEDVIAHLVFDMHKQGINFAVIARRLRISRQHASDIYEYITNHMRQNPRLIQLLSET